MELHFNIHNKVKVKLTPAGIEAWDDHWHNMYSQSIRRYDIPELRLDENGYYTNTLDYIFRIWGGYGCITKNIEPVAIVTGIPNDEED